MGRIFKSMLIVLGLWVYNMILFEKESLTLAIIKHICFTFVKEVLG